MVRRTLKVHTLTGLESLLASTFRSPTWSGDLLKKKQDVVIAKVEEQEATIKTIKHQFTKKNELAAWTEKLLKVQDGLSKLGEKVKMIRLEHAQHNKGKFHTDTAADCVVFLGDKEGNR